MAVVVAAALFAAFVPVQAPAPLPQNPSPMSDTTRPHPRVAAYTPRGQRVTLDEGTLFVRDGLRPSARLPLIVHFHGAPWLVEHQVSQRKSPAVLLTYQLGSGSGVYGRAFVDPARFGAALSAAADAASRVLGRSVTLDPVVLTSFSAGYGAIRAILRQTEHYARVSTVVLADSLHADYEGAPASDQPRTADPAVHVADIEVFLRLAQDAAAGRKRFLVTHSEVFPGTYASTTDTSNALLASLGLTRRARLREGPLGMQQLSETSHGGFTVLGFAGNSAPDHLDHLYALGEWLDRLR
jgi:hypothetical protein